MNQSYFENNSDLLKNAKIVITDVIDKNKVNLAKFGFVLGKPSLGFPQLKKKGEEEEKKKEIPKEAACEV